jgi:hypothetical protein
MKPTRLAAPALALGFVLLGLRPGAAQPPAGEVAPPVRAAIVEAVRPSFEWLVGGSGVLGPGPATFERPTIRVIGDWAFIRSELRGAEGGVLDPGAVPQGGNLVRPVSAAALLIRRAERWYLVLSDLEREDGVHLASFARHRPPPGLLP